jgi:hypothetical protein
VKPGGQIVVLNHFQSTQPVVAWFERVLNPVFVKVGWRSDLSLEEVLRNSELQVEYRFKMHLMDLWQIVVLRDPRHRRRISPPPVDDSIAVPSGRLLAMDGSHSG